MEGAIKMRHFEAEFPLPQGANIVEYQKANRKKEKKNHNKLQKFTYYKLKDDRIMKTLYKDVDNLVVLGYYPFTNPTNQKITAKELGNLNPQRLLTVEAAYIGHMENDIIIKKMKEIQMQPGKVEIETKDDNFEKLPIGNQGRFNQFLIIMKQNVKASQMSIRAFVDESKQKAQIIDYQFFFRETQLKMNKNIFG